MSLWTTLFLETWKERQVEKAMQWGMTGFAVSERPRPQFEGREIHSPVTGLPELYFPTAERFRLRAWSYVAMFWTLVLVFGVFACIMTAEASARPRGGATRRRSRGDAAGGTWIVRGDESRTVSRLVPGDGAGGPTGFFERTENAVRRRWCFERTGPRSPTPLKASRGAPHRRKKSSSADP